VKVGLVLLVAVAGCGKGVMEEPKTERIHSITWSSNPEDFRQATSFALYPSGFVEVQHVPLEGGGKLPKSGWYRIDDSAGLQKLFDRAKQGLRSKAYESLMESDIAVIVWTTVAKYTFRGDLLGMRDAALPSNKPFEFEKDGHDERWSALKTGSVIDAKY
jgi:hypothetical protein